MENLFRLKHTKQYDKDFLKISSKTVHSFFLNYGQRAETLILRKSRLKIFIVSQSRENNQYKHKARFNS